MSEDFFPAQDCENLGILPLSVTEKQIIVGAMNVELEGLASFVANLKEKTGSAIRVHQISSDEWEKWFSNDSSMSYSLDHINAGISSEYESILGTESLETSAPINDQEIYDGATEEKEIEENIISSQSDLYSSLQSDLHFEQVDTEEDEEAEYGSVDGEENLISSDEIVRAVANILLKSDEINASDIHVEPQETELRIRYRVDGILKKLYSIPKSRTSAIIARTKIISRLDVAEKRVPQDGRIRAFFGDKVLDFRVSTLPGKFGEKIVLRALRSDNSILDLGKLISEEREWSLLRQLCDNPYGIFIVVGPTGSGKSTTLYSILSENNDPGVNISTVEDPIEYTLPGLHQVQVVREKGLDFSRALRALMRQDPDVILVGETRDRETAQVAMEAALTGHMVFTTLHANDTATAISRLSEMGVAPYLISASVVGVLSQRLMRRVCSKCCQTVEADSSHELLQKYSIKSHKLATISKGGASSNHNEACQACGGSGYKGRVGVYEVLKIDDDIRTLILNECSADEIRVVSRERGMRTLLEYGMEMVRQGVSTLEEVERVCVLERDEEDEDAKLITANE